MKIKTHYYCLVDNNNKPNFQYIFTNKYDAIKKQKEIKNSSQGETLFVSKKKKEFFVDGIQKNLISPNKPIQIKKGCWVKLKTKKVSILDTISPEVYFQELVKTPKTSSISIKPTSETQNAAGPFLHKNTTHKSINYQGQSTQPFVYRHQNKKENLLQSSLFPPLKMNFIMINTALILIICFGFIVYNINITNKKIALAIAQQQKKEVRNKVVVLGAHTDNQSKKKSEQDNSNNNIDELVFNTLKKFNKIKTDSMETSIKEMVAGTPMEQMAPYIAKKNKIVAAFLIGIAKKESNWGRRVPILNGKDCYNYWGYRGIRKKMGTGGHTCFDSPKDAVDTVGGRIERLIKSGVDTPKKMVLWKCGSDCSATGGWASANKWIKDVNLYYKKTLQTVQSNEKNSEKMKVIQESLG